MSETYIIDEETMEICKALEFYDEHQHFPWDKKKVLVSLTYEAIEKLKDNRSEQINELILK